MFDSTLEMRNLEHGLKYLRTYRDNGKWLTVCLPTLCMESRCPDRKEPMRLRKQGEAEAVWVKNVPRIRPPQPGRPWQALSRKNCWRAVKQYIRASYRLGSDLTALILEAWGRIDQETINKMVDSMVVRMADVIACGGQMTGW